jgi:hypothetical protein
MLKVYKDKKMSILIIFFYFLFLSFLVFSDKNKK